MRGEHATYIVLYNEQHWLFLENLITQTDTNNSQNPAINSICNPNVSIPISFFIFFLIFLFFTFREQFLNRKIAQSKL